MLRVCKPQRQPGAARAVQTRWRSRVLWARESITEVRERGKGRQGADYCRARRAVVIGVIVVSAITTTKFSRTQEVLK